MGLVFLCVPIYECFLFTEGNDLCQVFCYTLAVCLIYFLKDFIYLYLERAGEGREKKRERNIDPLSLIRASTGD